MHFALRADETVPDGIQRIAREQVDAARADLEATDEDSIPEAVHDLRKRSKRLRAVARLVRGEVGDAYRPANHAFRDAARELSEVRDTQVLVEVLDALLGHADDGQGEATLDAAPVRDVLVGRHRAVTQGLARDPSPFERARAELDRGAEVVASWSLPDAFDALAGGLHRTSRDARRAWRRCREEPSTEDLHEWRKRVKDHWHHLQLLTEANPPLLEPWADAVHDLSDVLGDDHDLAVLVATLRGDPLVHGGESLVAEVGELAERRRRELQREAHRLGLQVSAEDPDAVVERLARWWAAWRQPC